ncbi:CRISPR-associated helicase, Cyano-type [Gloeothece citriformis PCC 7424]|uniref:CRISPR-associated helicase, Cyano-type n=1 Tax=Gloeothece citriformis (strain PCC 7424) TaxID=65393 RepID=B7KB37_GLOC7|nr:type I-D CRISPR-associated helicase Cas3' [Gloeothece citriformis]ACK70147.1 CRISPR-associated helicase, Cyano-type [Gloeothece citriformis PCC 7424]
MQIHLKPLYSKLNAGVGNCPLECTQQCRVRKESTLGKDSNYPCPLSLHQAETCAEILQGDADIIFNTSATGDGKSLAAYLAALIKPDFQIMGLYPTIELIEDQYRHLEGCYQLFDINQRDNVDFNTWCNLLYGSELAKRVKESEKNKFQELWRMIKSSRITSPILLTNPDIFHLITHSRYLDIAYDPFNLIGTLARDIDLWVFDEFHIFGAHQETAVLNSLLLIKSTQQKPKKFLFTSATPKEDFIKHLKQAGFNPKIIGGQDYYTDQKTDELKFRPIIQPIKLEFVQLPENDTLLWLQESKDTIQQLLQKEVKGRGLIIVNSVALAGKIVRQLRDLFEDQIRVEEISGRISRKQRKETQEALINELKPVLVVGTSAVDVGVDFKIHLLIFETSDSATVTQRLGRLGRHKGFSNYHAFILIPKRTPWILSRLEKEFTAGETYSRPEFQEKIETCLNAPQEFWQYRYRWGIKQVQGMLHQLSKGNKERQGVMQPVVDKMKASLIKLYPGLNSFNYWQDNPKNPLQKMTQEQLLSFRGSSNLQAAVWDNANHNHNFYTYDLLRLLPYTEVEVIDRETFTHAAQLAGHIEEEFPDEYIQVYLKIHQDSWLEQRQEIELKTKLDPDILKTCTLSILSKMSIINHPQASEINAYLNRKKILAFLIPLANNSHWDIKQMLYLKPTFGLYQLTDLDNQRYACAFNHDALLLDALAQCKKLKEYCQAHSQPLFF